MTTVDFVNPFVKPREEYKRDLNVRTHYVEDTALYLSKMTGQPLEKCREYVKKNLQKGGKFEFKDPTVFYLERGENGDREKKVGTMSQYIGESIKGNHLIAPTFTTYLPVTVKQSLLVDYIDSNVAARSVAKKAMFKAKVSGDKQTEITKKIEQQYRKINNNSISGAHVSPSTPLYNPTAHSTLTSVCRSTSGYGNANNEKFLCGNRHYWSPAIARNNIISIINHTDYVALENAMKKFGIRHPTVEETIQCLAWSTDLYWHMPRDFYRLGELIHKLTPLERSAFVYTGDLYHLACYNEEVVRTFIGKLSKRIGVPHLDPESVLSKAPEDHRHLAAQICPNEMRLPKNVKVEDIKDTPAYAIYASTTEHVGQVLMEYEDMIKALWVTENVPASVAHLPESVRRCAVTSDTDSTIFTVQDWVRWYHGKIAFNPTCAAVAASMIFLAAQTITHVLARMSANFGIENKRLFQIAMKNEYAFDVFVATQVAKHYYALIGCQEGNLYAEHEKEIKGVHLKSSKAPKVIMKRAENMMIHIMETVMAEEDVNLQALLKEVADIERSVMESIRMGSYEYFSFTQIKTPNAYKKDEMQTPYMHYLWWDEVFAPKYGKIEQPPYTCLKVSVELRTATQMKRWIDGMKDRELAARIQAWNDRTGKKAMGTMQLPEPLISVSGIPEEILNVIDSRKIVMETTKVFRLIFQTLGVYLPNGDDRLFMDYY